ncbi:MAG: hypothetical protein N3D10_00100 [Candidatus Micrarchaeota archaeon]|nr:hypothetical protein [Candidatus Micrarchaeota archaeon]
MISKEFLKLKPTAILLCLKDETKEWYPSKIAKYSGASYVYTTNFLEKLSSLGLVSLEKKGKEKVAKLTEKGKVIAGLIDEIEKRLKEQKQQEIKKEQKDATLE